jgi:hypothetical protein
VPEECAIILFPPLCAYAPAKIAVGLPFPFYGIFAKESQTIRPFHGMTNKSHNYDKVIVAHFQTRNNCIF